MKAVLLTVAANLLLLLVSGVWQHWTSGSGLTFLVVGLVAVFPALEMSFRRGWLVVGLTGAFWEASLPLPFGSLTLLLWLAHAILFVNRGRFRGEGVGPSLRAALIVNGMLFLALALLWNEGRGTELSFWGRVGIDWVLSQAFLLPLGWWYFRFLKSLFAVTDSSPRSDLF